MTQEQVCKPGSVVDDHLSRPCITAQLKPPLGDGRAAHVPPITVLLQVGFTERSLSPGNR